MRADVTQYKSTVLLQSACLQTLEPRMLCQLVPHCRMLLQTSCMPLSWQLRSLKGLRRSMELQLTCGLLAAPCLTC